MMLKVIGVINLSIASSLTNMLFARFICGIRAYITLLGVMLLFSEPS